MNKEGVCLTNCVTTHTLISRYFFNLILVKANANVMSDTINLIEGSERVNITLPNGTRSIWVMLYISIESKRNLLSFKDVHRNYYFIETMNESNMKYLSTLLILFLAKSL